MSALDFLLPWDSQPQEAVGVDVDGLAFASTLAGFAQNSVTGAIGSLASDVTYQVTQRGIALKGGASTNASFPGARIVTSNGAGTGDFAIGCWSNPANAGTRYNQIGQWVGTGNLEGAFLSANNNLGGANGGYFGFITYSAGYAGVSAAAMVDGNWHHWVGVRENGFASLYRDGVLVAGPTAITVKNVTASASSISLLYDQVNAVSASNSILAPFALNRALSAGQVAGIYANTWQLFAPRSIAVPVSAGGGTDGNASTAPASSTLTAPTATGSGSAQASTAPAGSTLTAPTATASASALASGALAGLTLAAPSATATGTAADGYASGEIAGMELAAPTATASNGEAANNAGGRKKRRIDEIRAYDDVFIPAPEVTTGTVPSDTVVEPIGQGGSNPATVGPSKLAPESKPRAPRKTKAPRVVSVAPIVQVAPEPTAAVVAAPEPAPAVAVAKPAPRPMMLSDMLAAESMTNEEMLAAIKMLARLHMGPQLVRSPRPQLIRGR